MARRKKKDLVEPLQKAPDYLKQRHVGQAETVPKPRLYFVDQNYKKLLPTAESVETGEPNPYKPVLTYLPRKGDYIVTVKKQRFEVLRVEFELRLTELLPPKIYIILRPVNNK